MTRFNVVVAAYNSEKWIEKNLKSLDFQTYNNWRGIIIDDCSSDGTREIIERSLPAKMVVIFNNRRKRALCNLVSGIKELKCKDEDVIVIVDGDDWLPDDSVFNRLAGVYKNPNVWLTYGSYEIHPKNRISDKTRPATIHDNPRKGPMIYRHLRTFKYFLWKNLRDESLRYTKTGEYYLAGYDAAIMRPMVEMAGLFHIQHISSKMYVYNFTNPLGDGKVNRRLQRLCGEDVALNQKPYSAKTKKELEENNESYK